MNRGNSSNCVHWSYAVRRGTSTSTDCSTVLMSLLSGLLGNGVVAFAIGYPGRDVVTPEVKVLDVELRPRRAHDQRGGRAHGHPGIDAAHVGGALRVPGAPTAGGFAPPVLARGLPRAARGEAGAGA